MAATRVAYWSSRQNYNAISDSFGDGRDGLAQHFTINDDYDIGFVRLEMRKNLGSIITVHIYSRDGDDPSASLGSKTVDATGWSSIYTAYHTITFDSPISLVAGDYAIVVTEDTLYGTHWLGGNVGSGPGGALDTKDSGSTWQNMTNPESTLCYEVWATSDTVVYAEGTKTVTAVATVDYTTGPGKARYPNPVDDAEDVRVRGLSIQKRLSWSAPSNETPDYKIYFRQYGGNWALYDSIEYNIDPHYTLLPNIVFDYYAIYEWRVDTYDPETELITTGDTWTFISEPDLRWTEYTRRSDYNANKIWQPGTGWVDINSLEFTGGGRFKNRILVIGHKVLYFGDA